MPIQPQISVFTRTGHTAGNQEKVENLVIQWKGNEVEITVGLEKITFTAAPDNQKAGELLVKNIRAHMEKFASSHILKLSTEIKLTEDSREKSLDT
ncbi:hypothetical protein FPRO03_06934 [Fusarium proliferatum]|nr:hypothetical protein FPRO03_06934 [Fusarium proliferatum]